MSVTSEVMPCIAVNLWQPSVSMPTGRTGGTRLLTAETNACPSQSPSQWSHHLGENMFSSRFLLLKLFLSASVSCTAIAKVLSLPALQARSPSITEGRTGIPQNSSERKIQTGAEQITSTSRRVGLPLPTPYPYLPTHDIQLTCSATSVRTKSVFITGRREGKSECAGY